MPAIYLAGLPIPARLVLELARVLRDTELVDTAERFEARTTGRRGSWRWRSATG